MDEKLITILENKLKGLEKEKVLLLSKLQQLYDSSSDQKVFYHIYDLYSKSFNTSAIPKYYLDIKGSYIQVNDAYCQFLDTTADEILGKNFLEYTCNDDIEKSNFHFGNLISEKNSSIYLEKKFITKNGKVKWGNVFVEPFYNSKKQFVFFMAQVLDVTTKKENEIAISNSFSAFSSILDNMDNMVIVCNLIDKTIIFTNKRTEEIFGTILGKKCNEVFANGGESICSRDFSCLDKSYQVDEISREIYVKKAQKWYNINESVIKWLDGEFYKLIIADNITEQKNLVDQISDSEKRFKVLSDSSFEAIFVSENGYYIEVNQTACELFGYTYEELIGKFGPDIFSEECRLTVKENTLTGYEKPYEAVALKKNQQKFFVEIRGKTFEYMGRQVRVAAVRDVTDKKLSIKSIQESEEKYKNLYEANPEPIIIHNNGTIIHANKASIDFFKASKLEDFLGQDIRRFVHPDYVSAVSERIRNFKLKNEFGKLVEEKFITFNNEIKDIEVYVVPVIFDKDYVSMVFFRDITERKNAENLLKSSEEKFKNIADVAFDAIILIDEEGKIKFWNKAAEKIFQYSANEIIGKNLHKILLPENIFNKNSGKLINLTENNFKNLDKKIFISKTQRKDNSEIDVEISLSSFKFQDKWHAVSVVRDITQRIENEKNLLESEQKLIDLNATKDKFFSIIAHDLKNPFNQFIGFTDLLMSNIKDYTISEIEEFVRLLNKSAKNGYQLLENLLEWSRTQTNKKIFYPEIFLIKDFINKNVEALKNNANIKNIEIEFEIPENVTVFADVNMVQTVLRNLVSNAIKFTKNFGKIKISTFKEKKVLKISVKDSGVGISDEDLQKLFRIDIHHSTKGTDNEAGTGLGLILCKEFITMNSGNIWVESKINEGSTFTFTLPVASREEEISR